MVGSPGSTNRITGAAAIELLDVNDRQTQSPECSSTAELISTIASPSAALPSEQEFKDFKFDETVSVRLFLFQLFNAMNRLYSMEENFP